MSYHPDYATCPRCGSRNIDTWSLDEGALPREVSGRFVYCYDGSTLPDNHDVVAPDGAIIGAAGSSPREDIKAARAWLEAEAIRSARPGDTVRVADVNAPHVAAALHGRSRALSDLAEELGQPKVYLAGPMRGKPAQNVAAFYAAEGAMVAAGFTVYNPARVDTAEGHRFDTEPCDDVVHGCMRRDLRAVLSESTGAVFFLPGWQRSAGATLESQVAEAVGIPRFALATDFTTATELR